MPSTLPEGEPVPADGSLPVPAGARPLGWYVHVPYCASRCGYCDFNTYAIGPGATAPGGMGAATAVGAAPETSGAGSPVGWAAGAVAEVALAGRVLGPDAPPARTVFFGGGTPTLMPTADLARVLGAIRETFGFADDVEITTEANPESVTQESLVQLRAAGFNRLSLGVQSATPHVLATLDRHHTPGRAADVVGWARAAGFDQLSLDLIYGTPGETLSDWETTLRVAGSLHPDHLSAYALIVEPGTRLAAKIARGELPAPDDDDLADKYLLADEAFVTHGLTWYEVSNWAVSPAARCRHNLGYWHGDDWWGVGPGAHSHVDGVRWWNVKHPAQWASRLAEGRSPGAGREVLDPEQRRVEDVLLRVRLAEGLSADRLLPSGRRGAETAVSDGLIDPDRWSDGRVVLTQQGRLLADAVVRSLLPD